MYLKDIPAFRQAFIVAAVLILTGIVLSQLIHQYFILLPVFVGGGLLFSGIVGWCPMALILQKFPWNTGKNNRE